MHALRKSYGPLSAGTRVRVVVPAGAKWEKRGDTIPSGYAVVRLEHVSNAFRKQVEGTKYNYLLGAFDIEDDLLMELRPRTL